MTISSDELRKMAAKRLASRMVRDHMGVQNVPDPPAMEQEDGELTVCLVHGRQTARKVLSLALERGLESPVHRYGSCEDALRYVNSYNVFVVYNNFGKRMNGAQGVARIRGLKPEALIIGVTSVPDFRHKFRAAGASDTVLLSGNEVGELIKKIEKSRVGGDSASKGR